MKFQPVVLEGEHVRLEPLAESHHADLCEIGLDPELWKWIPFRVQTPDEMMAYIRDALKAQAAGSALPFATVERKSGRAIGTTRYMNIDVPNRHVEIGSTWIARDHQRSLVNTEVKFLMLRHAFETLGCWRVELKTDSLNKRSRNAIQRIGARQEGIFRKHMATWSGRIRDTVYFSILDSEWPDMKARLEAKLTGSRDAKELRRVETLNESQVEDLYRLYQDQSWSRGRTIEDVRVMLDATDLIIAFVDASNDKLIAFARAITDEKYRVLVLDVIVDPGSRKRGLGKLLMDTIVAHPRIKDAQCFELYCQPDMIPFYERWGFREPDKNLRFMRRG